MTVFENQDKETLWEMYWQGFKTGKGVESVSDISKRTAREQFERYLSREYE